jgi:ABC-type nitrate/sulfonate/bicarbonate transport system permease component
MWEFALGWLVGLVLGVILGAWAFSDKRVFPWGC